MSFEGGDKDPVWDRANAPEHIEVVKTDVQYKGDVVVCEFQFAKAVEHETLEAMFEDRASTVNTVISNVFITKKWSVDDENIQTSAEDSEDGKTWTIYYHKVAPSVPPRK